MVAYAYAARYPGEVDRIVLMDAFLRRRRLERGSGCCAISGFPFLRQDAACVGYGARAHHLEHFWNDFAADPKKSLSEADRKFTRASMPRPGHMAAGMEVFRASKGCRRFRGLCQDAAANAMLVLSGEKAAEIS